MKDFTRIVAIPHYVINIDYLERLGLYGYTKAHINTFHRRLFFEKMQDWRNENEFRWVVFTDTEDDLFIDYGDSLTGIVFGDRTKDEDIEEIIEMTTNENVELMGLKWHNCSPWYDIGNLKYNRNFRKLSSAEKISN